MSATAALEPARARQPGSDKLAIKAWAVLGVLAGAASPLGMAQAQDAYVPGGSDRTDAQRTVPNVPDAHGCVRLCELDLNPCDPPIYKREDGRCTRKD